MDKKVILICANDDPFRKDLGDLLSKGANTVLYASTAEEGIIFRFS